MNTDLPFEYKELTECIIGYAYRVSNTLGIGFLEKVYENALAIELRDAGLLVEQQKPLHVFYRGRVVGDYFADMIVENKVLVELKSCKAFDESHRYQCLNYLRATNLKVGLVINLGTSRIDIKRVVN